MARPSRDDLLTDPRSGARPLGGSPGPEATPEAKPRRTASPPGDRAPEDAAPPRRDRDSRRPPGRGSSGTSGRTGTRRRSPGGSGRPDSGTRSTARRTSSGAAAADSGGSDGQAAGKSKKGGGRKRSRPGLPGGEGGARNYQAVILAEFVTAELLVALTPIATRPNQPGLSPYVPRDMTKMIAIGLSYFMLQLISTTGRGAGRFGAWFGALILLAVGLNEAASVSKVLNLFAPDTSSAAASTPAAGTPATLATSSKPAPKSGTPDANPPAKSGQQIA